MAGAAAAVADENTGEDLNQEGQLDETALDEEGQEETAQPNPEAEKVARLMGWKPAEEWEGDKSNHLSAEDFLVKQPEITRNLRRKAEANHDKLVKVAAEVAKLSRNQRQQIDAGLEAELVEVVEAGNTKRALEIVDQIKKGAQPDAEDVPAFDAFKERNAWYGVNRAATAAVHALDREFNQDGSGGKNPEAHFRKIEAALKEDFPTLFAAKETKEEPKPGQRAPLVQRGGRLGNSRPSGEMTVADMSSAMRRAADDLGVKHADYIKSYNLINADKVSR